MIGPLDWLPARVEALMKVKGLGFNRDDYVAFGFDRGWIGRKTRTDPPGRPQDAIRLADWLDVPVDYLFGGAPEYDGKPAWEVASRASLDLFLRRRAEGREVARYRQDFEDHIATAQEQAPKTVAAWVAAMDLIARARGREREETERLERGVGG